MDSIFASTIYNISQSLMIPTSPTKKLSANEAITLLSQYKEYGETINANKYRYNLQGRGYVSVRVVFGKYCKDFGFYLKPAVHNELKKHVSGGFSSQVSIDETAVYKVLTLAARGDKINNFLA